MGREMRRKNAREMKKKNSHYNSSLNEMESEIHLGTVLKIVLAVALILFVLYYALAVFVTKEIDVSSGNDSNTAETDTTSNSVSNKILAAATFNQKEEVYYVYYYDFSDEDESISSSISNRSDLKIYRVDTSSSLNSKYVTEDSGNASVSGIGDLKVKNPTLIQVTADQVTGYYEGSSSILGFLNS